MASNHIPPQAYTREDVAKAYVWVQSQPEYVKNMATSKEALVALYLQARRNGVSSLENIAPVSSKDFKNQLQSLATELNQFEKQKETLKAQAPLNPPQQSVQHSVQQSNEIPDVPDFTQNYEIERDPPSARFDERSIEFKVSERRQSGVTVDHKSRQMIDTVKAELNIESDTDVVRMLLTLGYDKLKTIFPNRS